jgi:hypothetical protein
MAKGTLTAEQAAATPTARAQHLEDAVRALLESEGWARWCACAVYPPHPGTGFQPPVPGAAWQTKPNIVPPLWGARALRVRPGRKRPKPGSAQGASARPRIRPGRGSAQSPVKRWRGK